MSDVEKDNQADVSTGRAESPYRVQAEVSDGDVPAPVPGVSTKIRHAVEDVGDFLGDKLEEKLRPILRATPGIGHVMRAMEWIGDVTAGSSRYAIMLSRREAREIERREGCK